MKTRFFFITCITTTLLMACQATATATPTPTELPTNTPEPSNTPLPTSTPVPPTPTITPTPTPNIIHAAMLDNFNDKTFDGSFNSDIWQQGSYKGATCIVTQKDGALFVSQKAGLIGSFCGLSSWKSANWLLTDLNRIDARVKLTAKEGYEWAGLNIQLVSNNTNWYITCQIAKARFDQPYMNCWTPNWTTPPNPGGVGGFSFNSWHTFRMVIDPQTVTFKFYIDGNYYASYTPPEVMALKDDSFHLEIGLWNSANTSASAYVDDIYIGPKPK